MRGSVPCIAILLAGILDAGIASAQAGYLPPGPMSGPPPAIGNRRPPPPPPPPATPKPKPKPKSVPAPSADQRSPRPVPCRQRTQGLAAIQEP